MKTFHDLQFEPHFAGMGGIQARMTFPNGYGVSVIQGGMFYTGNDSEYELGVLGPDGFLTYTTPITGYVLGYLTEAQVTDYMRQVQELPNAS